MSLESDMTRSWTMCWDPPELRHLAMKIIVILMMIMMSVITWCISTQSFMPRAWTFV